MHADMAGQLFVRLIEAPESAPVRALDDVVPSAFTRLSFAEAIAFFLSKRIITPDEFHALSDAAKANAFTATRLASDQLRQRAFDLIAATLQDGGTLDDFSRGLRDGELSLGIEAASSGYLETVFRTNVQSAYGAGRLRQIQSDAVRTARPFVEYRTAGDNRVRPSHAVLDRVVFRQDDPEWTKYAPPNGFQCRCAAVTLRESQVDRSRVRNAADLEVQPDKGFAAAPSGPDDSE
jgi:SPP1 gp7 family putative phage head morphogenesis protein